MLDRVVTALSRLRLNTVPRETSLYCLLERVFLAEGIAFNPQVWVAPASRIDYLLEGGVGVEVKSGVVDRRRILAQLERYAASDVVRSLLLVTERGVSGLPREMAGKRVRQVSLQGLWGIAS